MKPTLFLVIITCLLFACDKKDPVVKQPVEQTDTPRIDVPDSGTVYKTWLYAGEVDYSFDFDRYFDTLYFDTLRITFKAEDSLFIHKGDLYYFRTRPVDSVKINADGRYYLSGSTALLFENEDSVLVYRNHSNPGGVEDYYFRGKRLKDK